MKVLIIYAHPETEGFCSLVLNETLKGLKSRKTKYNLIDLYKEKYNPILKKEEHYSSGNRLISKDTKKFQDLIKKHDKIVLIYPIWWSGPPAILKGFFERTLTPGFGFKFEGRIPHKLFGGKKLVAFITHSSPMLYTKFILGDRGIKSVLNDTLEFCGISTKFFRISNARRLNDKRALEVRKKVEKGLNYLIK